MHLKRLLLILPFLLSGCREESNLKKIPLFSFAGSVQETRNGEKGFLLSLTDAELKNRVERKASFPLFVYSQGCGTCDLFSYTIQGYLKSAKTVFPFRTLSNYLLFDSSASFSESVILFYSEGKIVSTVSNLPEEYSSFEAFSKRRNKYTFVSSANVLNGYENRLGLTYSSDYPTYRIKTDGKENMDFTNRKNKDLCIVNSSQADFSSFNTELSYFYFLDNDSFHQKSQEVLSTLGLDASSVSGKNSIWIRFGEDGKASILN